MKRITVVMSVPDASGVEYEGLEEEWGPPPPPDTPQSGNGTTGTRESA